MKKKFTTAGMFIMVVSLIWVVSNFYGCIFLSGVLVRGGVLYDKWWNVSGVKDSTEPTGDHILYPEVGEKSGSTTWRCKECHGWDYMGKDGAYGSGSHFTGLDGVYDSRAKSPIELGLFLKAGDHDFSAHLSDQDIADVAAFITGGLIDMSEHINADKTVNGDATNGATLYAGSGQCVMCHGEDGKTIDFHDGEGVGGVARDNPWETLHKIRFGHPGTTMPSSVEEGLSIDDEVDILTFCQGLGLEE